VTEVSTEVAGSVKARELIGRAVLSMGDRTFTIANIRNAVQNGGGPLLTNGQIRWHVSRHPRVMPVERGSGRALYRLSPEVPEGHAVLGVWPCGCVNFADSRPTGRSYAQAQEGDCHAEIVPMDEAQRRFRETWGHKKGCKWKKEHDARQR
jgi:hypothetical protein